jgi:hypothetical protein
MVANLDRVPIPPFGVGFHRVEDFSGLVSLDGILVTPGGWSSRGASGASTAGRVYGVGDTVEIPVVLGQLRLAGERCSGPW